MWRNCEHNIFFTSLLEILSRSCYCRSLIKGEYNIFTKILIQTGARYTHNTKQLDGTCRCHGCFLVVLPSRTIR